MTISRQISFFLLTLFFWAGCSGTKKISQLEVAPRQPQATRIDENSQDINPYWEEIHNWNKPGLDMPSAGEDAAIVFDHIGNRLVLFGGKTDQDEVLNETWFYFPETHVWKQLMESKLSPPTREDHVLIFDPVRNAIIMHGGEDGDTSNDIWELDLATLQWHIKSDTSSPPMENHEAVYARSHFGAYFFGGRNKVKKSMNDLWFLNLDPNSDAYYTWKKIESEGSKIPDSREDFSMMFDEVENRLLIFGGWNRIAKEFTTDTWEFRFDKNKWREIKHKSKAFYPPHRRHAGSAFDEKNRIWIIFGGQGIGGPLNDTWGFDLATDKWENLTPGPPPRIDHSLIYDPVSGEVFLFGGDRAIPMDSRKLHDLWKLKLRDHQTEKTPKSFITLPDSVR